MQINHDKKLIFVQIPKNASTSICTYFGGPNQFVYDKKWTAYQEHFGNYWNEYTKFAVVRNPIDRLISSYKFIREGNYNILQMNFNGNSNTNINEFLDFVVENYEDIVTPILKPQHYFICNENNDVVIDNLIRYENLDQELKDIGIENIQLLNQSSIEDESLVVLTEQSIDKIKNLYAKDFQLFNYS